MAWRLQLSDRAIRRLDILTGKPSLLAAWVQPDRAVYLDLQTGARTGDRLFDEPKTDDRKDEHWQAYLKTLTAPNNMYLPYVRGRNTTVYTTSDGRMHLYRVSDNRLFLQTNGKEVRLELAGDAAIADLGLDRTLGLLAILDRAGKIHIYQQHVRVGIFDSGLNLRDDIQPELVVSHGGSYIFATDGEQIVLFEPSGKIRHRLALHYTLGVMACSPDGKLLVTSDMEAGVVRIYNGPDLRATHQRFAVDLLADAKRAPQGGSAGSITTAVGALSLNNKGVLAFAASGMVCVTNLARLKAVPRQHV
jgi:hypothetical protein